MQIRLAVGSSTRQFSRHADHSYESAILPHGVAEEMEDWMTESVFGRPGAGAVIDNPVGGRVVFKVRGDQTDGRLTAFETVVAPGDGPPLHVHATEDETLYVIEGEVRFRLDDELCDGGTGSFVFVPRGTRHTFQNIGAHDARMLIHFSPSGMERFFDRFAALHAPDGNAFARIGAEVGMNVVGPPLAQSG
jgi:quercetin dioxygenase-like cupin family protein